MRIAALFCLAAFGLSACATANETRPGRTASEQLLMNHAAEKAARSFWTTVPAGTRVFIDTSYFRGEGADYAISALRDALMAKGGLLADDRNVADVVVEVRLGALSMDQMNRVLGIPSLTLPVSPNFTNATIPELSIYSRRDRTGVAEFSAFAYDARTGRPVALATRAAGETHIRSHKMFMVFTWGPQEVRPGDQALDPAPWWKLW